ncbi:MAG: hypothetical protein E7277_06345 [Lachnospiraceae bacterium]|nr:hypothetical protein [Lachnospiraceae bacterium]
MANLSRIVTNQLEQVIQEKQILEKEFKKFPPGKLLVAKDRKWNKWYCSLDGEKILIPKKNVEYAKTMARKRYVDAKLKDLKQEQFACEAYLRSHNKPSAITKFTEKTSPYYPLIFSNTSKDAIMEWFHNSFTNNPEYPNQRIFKSSSGNYLRSKSEVLIDELLSRHHLLFHYEEILSFSDGSYFYPDFKIYSPKLGQFIYWEHFGKMDDPYYAEKTYRKISKYIQNGFLPQKNLIFTFETKDSPLDYEYVEMLIQQFFL